MGGSARNARDELPRRRPHTSDAGGFEPPPAPGMPVSARRERYVPVGRVMIPSPDGGGAGTGSEVGEGGTSADGTPHRFTSAGVRPSGAKSAASRVYRRIATDNQRLVSCTASGLHPRWVRPCAPYSEGCARCRITFSPSGAAGTLLRPVCIWSELHWSSVIAHASSAELASLTSGVTHAIGRTSKHVRGTLSSRNPTHLLDCARFTACSDIAVIGAFLLCACLAPVV